MSFIDDLYKGYDKYWWGGVLPGGEGPNDRPEGPPSNVPDPNRGNFQLPGADARGDFLRGGAMNAQGREAPQAGESSFRGDQQALVDRLRRQMSGEDSLSEMQFRNATDANIAQQRSLAAGANPGNASMMARLAAQNIGRMNQGYGQQAAMLGIQERNAAANALGGVAQGARGQDQQQSQFNVGAQLTQRGMNDQYTQGMSDLELRNAGMVQGGNMGYEQNNTQRYGIDKGVPQQPSNLDTLLGRLGSVASLSDERAKTNISTPAAGGLDRLIANLQPQTYEYRDQRNGAGPRVGVMAQDVERGGPAGRALVSETGAGKALDVPKSLGTALGLIGRLGERIDQLEGGGAVASRTKQTARVAPPQAADVASLYARPEELVRERRPVRPEELQRERRYRVEHERDDEAEFPWVQAAFSDEQRRQAEEMRRQADVIESGQYMRQTGRGR